MQHKNDPIRRHDRCSRGSLEHKAHEKDTFSRSDRYQQHVLNETNGLETLTILIPPPRL